MLFEDNIQCRFTLWIKDSLSEKWIVPDICLVELMLVSLWWNLLWNCKKTIFDMLNDLLKPKTKKITIVCSFIA